VRLIALFFIAIVIVFGQGANAPILQRGTSAVADLKDGSAMSTAVAAAATATAIPPGLIVLSLTGCATGWSEVAALNGKTIIGTLVANGDVGTTGGSNTITPTGTISAPVFVGSLVTSSAASAGTPAGTVAAPIFTGIVGQATSAVTAGTPAGTIAAPIFTGSALATHQHELPIQFSTTDTQIRILNSAVFGAGSSRAAAVQWTRSNNATVAPVMLDQPISAGTPAGTISAPVFTGSPLATHSHALTPAGAVSAPLFTGSALAPHTHTLTATGTNSVPTLTGNSFENRSAFTRVIFCSKN